MLLDLIDVFATGPLSGNPLAVVRGGDGLSDAQMLAITRWLGYSETTFLLPADDPGADYKVRIFYPAGELPFAGHPTLGTCHSWLMAGGAPRQDSVIVQQCPAGLIAIRREPGMLSFKAPPLNKDGALDAHATAKAAALLAIEEDWILDAVHADNGPGWVLLRLRTVEDVLRAAISQKPEGVANIGIFAAYGDDNTTSDFEVRAFFTNPDGTLAEDPVTGSLNAAMAQYVFANALATGSYRATQGQAVGAKGLVHCEQAADGAIWIGGRTNSIATSATLHMPS